MAKRGGTKLNSGNYRVQVYIGKDENGKRKYQNFIAPSRDEAQRQALEFKLKLKAEADKYKYPTLNNAINAYIESRRNSTAAGTIRGYQSIRRASLGKLSKMHLDEIDAQALQVHFDSIAGELSYKTRKNHFSLMSAVFTYYKLEIPQINLGRKEKVDVRVPTREECKKILKILVGSSVELPALLALTCSLTQSEIGALTPAHVEGNRLHVRGALVLDENNNFVKTKYNKNEVRTRDVIMPDYVAAKMQELCAEIKDKNETLFKVQQRAILNKFKRLCEKNGLYPYTMHSLRHAFAAWMHNEGAPDQYIMKAGGWKTPHVMQKVYQYAFEDEADRYKEAANKSFDLPKIE